MDCIEKENTGLRGKKQWNFWDFPKIKKLMAFVIFSLNGSKL